MQVHKETIDKVPAALPGRDSIEIEVFGMQGIPDDAFQGGRKGQGSDEPSPKLPRLSAASLLPAAMPPGFPPGMPPVPPGMPPGPPQFMVPPYGMMPPHFAPAVPPGMPSIYNRPPMSMPQLQPPRQLPPQLPPSSIPTPQMPPVEVKVLSAAPPNQMAASKESKNIGKTRIMHPDDLLTSLEERRAQLGQFVQRPSYHGGAGY